MKKFACITRNHEIQIGDVSVEIYVGSEFAGDGGEQLTLPMDNLQERLNEIMDKYNSKEIRIFDYESDLQLMIDFYPNYHNLNEELQELNDLREEEKRKVFAIAEAGAYGNLRGILDSRHNFTLQENILTEEDVGYDHLDIMEVEMDDLIMNNLDVKGIGRDILKGGGDILTSYGLLREH